ncbi:MAG: D-alanine--D-alanine ligase [Chitinophagales bacterium]|nr:D-alanine--D-alanine ligase [Chitinophagales bacterium]MDW8419948.1 D-alanine--D-alanine ligase [Chitinophagales bacterium]
MKKNIAVIAGGESSEAGISLKSAAVVCKYLNKEKYNVFKVIIEGSDWYVERDNPVKLYIDKNDFSFTVEGHKITFDAVFVAIHGTPAEDGKLQGYFDLLKIPYNCCGVLQAALTFDKQRCKEYLSVHGIRTARAALVKKSMFDEKKFETGIPLPLFVKPNKNGSSFGAAKVEKADALIPALINAFQYDDEVLIEEYLQGTEVTCGVIKHNGVITPLPVTEIRSKRVFFDYAAKYEGASEEITPAPINAELYAKIQSTSAEIYRILDFKGMCRIDYIICGDTFYMLEVNSVPGLSEESIVPQQAKAMGLTLEQLFGESIEACLKHHV